MRNKHSHNINHDIASNGTVKPILRINGSENAEFSMKTLSTTSLQNNTNTEFSYKELHNSLYNQYFPQNFTYEFT